MKALLSRISGPGAEEPLDVWEHIAMAEFVESFLSPFEFLTQHMEDDEYDWHERECELLDDEAWDELDPYDEQNELYEAETYEEPRGY